MQNKFHFKDFIKVFSGSILLYLLTILLFQNLPGFELFIFAQNELARFYLLYLIQFLIVFIPLWLFVIRPYKPTLKDFGLKKISWKEVMKTAGLVYLFYLGVSLTLLAITTYTGLEVPGYGPQEPHLPVFGESVFGFVNAFFFIVIIGPVLEEFFFRGYIYKTFKSLWNVRVASLLAAALFALIHVELQSFLPLMFLGLLLNYTYEKTGSLWTAIAFHVLNNVIAFSVELLFYLNPSLLEGTSAFLYNGLML